MPRDTRLEGKTIGLGLAGSAPSERAPGYLNGLTGSLEKESTKIPIEGLPDGICLVFKIEVAKMRRLREYADTLRMVELIF